MGLFSVPPQFEYHGLQKDVFLAEREQIWWQTWDKWLVAVLKHGPQILQLSSHGEMKSMLLSLGSIEGRGRNAVPVSKPRP